MTDVDEDGGSLNDIDGDESAQSPTNNEPQLDMASEEEVLKCVAEVTDGFSKPEPDKRRFRIAIGEIVNGRATIKVCRIFRRPHLAFGYRRRPSSSPSPHPRCTPTCTRRATCSATARRR